MLRPYQLAANPQSNCEKRPRLRFGVRVRRMQRHIGMSNECLQCWSSGRDLGLGPILQVEQPR